MYLIRCNHFLFAGGILLQQQGHDSIVPQIWRLLPGTPTSFSFQARVGLGAKREYVVTVLIINVRWLQGTGSIDDVGEGLGKNFALNVPVRPAIV
eukprot:SAG11_NODE_366_length_10128_cov_4.162030_7_plen_95_part_00